MIRKLIDHRREIEKNKDAYTFDLKNDRLVQTFLNHIKKDYEGIRFNESKKDILKNIILQIFQAQDNRPFFHVEGTELPLCWNRPADWNCNYIKYEWGHLLSKNQSVGKYNLIENLGLYSARCNQHIQSSMNIQELMVYGGLIAQRISNVLTQRRKLFESNHWKELLNKIEE
ncbi:MAG TPA: hypothetical protein PKL30_25740 [Leptospiraceae bacterium]|nr:hypothetical protein [Leptospiraceae bacterium]HMZ67031.1 hypothetical protein [Leptospiraceae bacterium]HNC59558.1 hypothetical protein [Leptospiraceae bacterium]HNE11408.1 hypothetical protein [Leptospiraceae bacterium]HNF57774.1 hypothetical protein [Leptospiraceae bacterium]